MRSASPRASGTMRLAYDAASFCRRSLSVAAACTSRKASMPWLGWATLDMHAGAILIEHVLHQFLHGLLGLLSCAGQQRLDIGFAHDLAHGALGYLLYGGFRILDVEEVFRCILNPP